MDGTGDMTNLTEASPLVGLSQRVFPDVDSDMTYLSKHHFLANSANQSSQTSVIVA